MNKLIDQTLNYFRFTLLGTAVAFLISGPILNAEGSRVENQSIEFYTLTWHSYYLSLDDVSQATMFYILSSRTPGWVQKLKNLPFIGVIGEIIGAIWWVISGIWSLIRSRVTAMKLAELDIWLIMYGDNIGIADCQTHEGKGSRYAECIMEEYNSLLEDWLDHYDECHDGLHPGRAELPDLEDNQSGRAVFDFVENTTNSSQWVCEQTNEIITMVKKRNPDGSEECEMDITHSPTLKLEPPWDATPWLE